MRRKFVAAGRLFVRMVRDESGGESLEYALVGGAVVVVSFNAIESVGERVTRMWQSLDQALTTVVR
jgi:Flp pilus assembly pilin Flp